MSEKPRPIDFYKEEGSREMMIEVVSTNGGCGSGDISQQQAPSQMVVGDSSGGEDHEVKAPKKRAETWVQDAFASGIELAFIPVYHTEDAEEFDLLESVNSWAGTNYTISVEVSMRSNTSSISRS